MLTYLNENYPSDIHFSINNTDLGYWVSPGDFGARRGRLKTLSINKEGIFIDGDYKISETTIYELSIDYTNTITFRFSVPKDTKNVGGFTLFGEDFGDYNQSIKMQTFYEMQES